jgi:uncharacterized protein
MQHVPLCNTLACGRFCAQISASQILLAPPNYRDTRFPVDISFDPPKRAKTPAERALDFAGAGLMFEGTTATAPAREGFGENRFITAGYLGERMVVVVVVWTPRGNARHVISMRHCYGKEQRGWRDRMG